MIEFLASALIASSNDPSEKLNKVCAYVVNIPYASDNFSDEEFQRFQYCRNHLKLRNLK